MAITIDTAEGRLVPDNGRHRIHDYGDFTISLTGLKGGKATREHCHGSTAEVYFSMGQGEGEMAVGGQGFGMGGGAILIPQGEFHRVTKESKDSDLTFVPALTGKRNEDKALYDSPKTAIEGQHQ